MTLDIMFYVFFFKLAASGGLMLSSLGKLYVLGGALAPSGNKAYIGAFISVV